MIYVNDNLITQNNFPNGESLLKLNLYPYSNDPYVITCFYESNEDLFNLYMIQSEILDRGQTSILTLPYLPYCRQDRRIKASDILTFKHFCKMINSLNFLEVYVWNPHVPIDNMIDRVSVVEYMKNYIYSDCDIAFPDNGAYTRYKNSVSENKIKVIGNKSRDELGKITYKNIFKLGEPENDSIIIIDDICSYGNTFYLFGKKLKELGYKKVFLYVTHLEKSILNEEKSIIFKEDCPIDLIIATNSLISFDEINNSNLNHKIDIIEIFDRR